MQPQLFGNTFYSLRGAALLALLLSIVVSLCVYFLAPHAGANLGRGVEAALVGLGILAVTLGAILPTCLFSLRVDDTHISHLLANRIVLSSRPLSDLQSVEIAMRIGAVLRFRDGSAIHFLGGRLEFLRDLCVFLRERCGDTPRIEFGARAAELLLSGGHPRRLPDTSLERTRER